jgi:hypothetical protein
MSKKMIAAACAVIVCASSLAPGLNAVRAETPTLIVTPAPPHTITPSSPPTETSAPSPTEIPTPTPSPAMSNPLTPLRTIPIGNLAQAVQTQPELAMIGSLGCLVLLAALLAFLVLFWRPRPRGAAPVNVPYLEHEDSGLRIYLKQDTMTLGRASNCDLKIAPKLPGADTVSPHHARLVKRELRWVVVDGLTDDEPSLNGIYVNGKRTLENYLAEDDEIAFGELKLCFRVPPTAAASGDAR